jgi:hypothetical protein
MTPTDKLKLIESLESEVNFPEKDLSLLIDLLLDEREKLILHFEKLFEVKGSMHFGDKFNNVSILVNDEKYIKQMLTNLIGNSKVKSVGEIQDLHLFDEFFNIFTTSV